MGNRAHQLRGQKSSDKASQNHGVAVSTPRIKKMVISVHLVGAMLPWRLAWLVLWVAFWNPFESFHAYHNPRQDHVMKC